MIKRIAVVATVCIAALFTSEASALERAEFDELSKVVDSAKVLEADIFAPKVFKKAFENYLKAKRSIQSGRDQKTINKQVAQAREYTENALKAAEVAKLSLQEYLEPRKKAQEAKAVTLVAELYLKAEQQFTKAAEKVESGNVKSGLKEAAKASPMFNIAELEAIKKDILGAPDKLIAKAEADDGLKYAPSTLDKARTARAKANAILSNDRYARAEAQVETDRASYEARHASNIALSVRSLNRNDQAWEKLMLLYEIQMNRIGATVGQERLPFDNGPFAAADTLIDYISDLQSYSKNVAGEAAGLSATLSKTLSATLSELGEPTSKKDPVELARLVGEIAARLQAENKMLDEEVHSADMKYASLSAEHDQIAAQLLLREERETKFKTAKRLLNPSEGEVLFNSSNDIVLRLSGLSFASGSSDIKDDHVQLLEKVQEVIEMFPDAQLVIEGHTDASGEASANMLLSEKRAFAVMQYLRQSMMLPADKVQSMGFGADRPIASNQTDQGRSKNRRIDVLIMQ